MHNQDGMDTVQCHMTNTRNAPAEVIESVYPLRIRSYGLVPDSDGPGRFREGLGMRREIEVLSEKTTLTVSTDRSRLQPWGAFGCSSGRNFSCLVEPDGRTEKLEYSKMTRKVNRGDVVTVVTPGSDLGGSVGHPSGYKQLLIWFLMKIVVLRDNGFKPCVLQRAICPLTRR